MIVVIGLFIALTFFVVLLRNAHQVLNALAPPANLRAFHTILLAAPILVIVALLFFVFAIAEDLRIERIAHGLLVLAGWMVVSIQIFSAFVVRQHASKPTRLLQMGQFLPVPLIIYLTPVQNFLRLFEMDMAILLALAGACAVIAYGYVVLWEGRPKSGV